MTTGERIAATVARIAVRITERDVARAVAANDNGRTAAKDRR